MEGAHAEHTPAIPPPTSATSSRWLKQTVSWLRGLWGPMRAEIEDEICEGDKVVARVSMHGRHVGEFLGTRWGPAGRGHRARPPQSTGASGISHRIAATTNAATASAVTKLAMIRCVVEVSSARSLT